MPLIAITGAVGAGKSEFTRGLSGLTGAEFIDTDRCARELLSHDEEVARKVRAAFGDLIVDEGGRIDRGALRASVFGSAERRRVLEAILHPRIREAWTSWARERTRPGVILLVEIPLLYETAAAALFDYVIVVGCSRETQRRRLTDGRQLPLATAEQMVASQWKIEDKVLRGDCLIWNDGSRRALENQTTLCLTRLPGASNPIHLAASHD